jgi:SAM-dependent methyltransferase
MFSRSLKKQQKLALLIEQIGEARDRDCLLVTHGDNNGALNHHLRAHGGRWTWVDNEAKQVTEMEGLLGETVLRGDPARIPVDDASFDLAVSIDVHEHLDDPDSFNRELHRTVRAGGMVVVTTPNGDLGKPLVALKNRLGMTKEVYGHRVIGYTVEQHKSMLAAAGLMPVRAGSYARFFTELLELGINFGYVKVLSRKGEAKVDTGDIAPTSQDRLRAVEKQYRLYSMIYPLLYAISRLDLVLLGTTGYAVSVVSQKPE